MMIEVDQAFTPGGGRRPTVLLNKLDGLIILRVGWDSRLAIFMHHYCPIARVNGPPMQQRHTTPKPDLHCVAGCRNTSPSGTEQSSRRVDLPESGPGTVDACNARRTSRTTQLAKVIFPVCPRRCRSRSEGLRNRCVGHCQDITWTRLGHRSTSPAFGAARRADSETTFATSGVFLSSELTV